MCTHSNTTGHLKGSALDVGTFQPRLDAKKKKICQTTEVKTIEPREQSLPFLSSYPIKSLTEIPSARACSRRSAGHIQQWYRPLR
jgi:hypothetical protein